MLPTRCRRGKVSGRSAGSSRSDLSQGERTHASSSNHSSGASGATGPLFRRRASAKGVSDAPRARASGRDTGQPGWLWETRPGLKMSSEPCPRAVPEWSQAVAGCCRRSQSPRAPSGPRTTPLPIAAYERACAVGPQTSRKLTLCPPQSPFVSPPTRTSLSLLPPPSPVLFTFSQPVRHADPSSPCCSRRCCCRRLGSDVPDQHSHLDH